MVAGGTSSAALAWCLGRCNCRRRAPNPLAPVDLSSPRCYPAVAARQCREGLPGLAPAREFRRRSPRSAGRALRTTRHRASGRGLARRSGRRRRALSLRHDQPLVLPPRTASPTPAVKPQGLEQAGPCPDTEITITQVSEGPRRRGVPVQRRRGRPGPPVLRAGAAHLPVPSGTVDVMSLMAGGAGAGHAGGRRAQFGSCRGRPSGRSWSSRSGNGSP